ncbi:DMT family transporter [Amycolatopsis rubida]|uniref:DMT family transporter n=1 Tax=Amycolatopsis rubida TaxID=112413 RepID=A0ABX0BX34_9PSEU|nr:EamA family transporter [Amycolatopsis sp. M39]MYW93722.1 EamA family transporter [Amycolatopsis rubida]NEC58709.1 DMT family transporter [Amycolatopsis rubida]OAP22902.1 EamA-like transporter family protein [Amycolatopsis sp. M39]
MGEVLALLSALCFGLADFSGGLLSRRSRAALIGFLGQVSGLLATVVASLVVAAPHVDAPSLLWGALSGIGTGTGVLFLYRGMGRGRMSVVVPLSDVGGVALPVLAGVVLLSNRPSLPAWGGIVVALPALWLIAREGGDKGNGSANGALDGLLAGIGFALQNIALGQVDPSAGMWPIAISRLLSALTLFPAVLATPGRFRIRPRLLLPAALTGIVAAAAIVLYTLATRQQLLAIAVVLSSLYPAIPVVLGILLLKEKLRPSQVAGLVGAGAAIVLLAI